MLCSHVPDVVSWYVASVCALVFFFQAEDGIRDLVRSRGLGDVYKRQLRGPAAGGQDRSPATGDLAATRAPRAPAGVTRCLSLIHI